MIKARNIDPASPLRYVELENVFSSTTAITTGGLGVWAFPARYPVNLSQAQASAAQAALPYAKIVDVILWQTNVGTGGTSQTFNILKNGTTIWATNPVMALASGANAAFDTLGVLAVPTGATRGVFATTAGLLNLKKGDVLACTMTITGTYTVAPVIGVTVIVDTNPV